MLHPASFVRVLVLTVSAVFVTILAIYGAIVARFKGNLSGLTAIGADYLVHLLGGALSAIPGIAAAIVVVPTGTTLAGTTFPRAASARTARFSCSAASGTPFRLGKAAFLVERLLAGRKHECPVAVCAYQCAILEI
jgi:hypothetical protein